MEITILDFVLINCLSYIGGIGTGIIICCNYKDNFMVRSRSTDNLTQTNNNLAVPNTILTSTPAIMASAPPSHNPIKITLE
jgi:hypothetical protein